MGNCKQIFMEKEQLTSINILKKNSSELSCPQFGYVVQEGQGQKVSSLNRYQSRDDNNPDSSFKSDRIPSSNKSDRIPSSNKKFEQSDQTDKPDVLNVSNPLFILQSETSQFLQMDQLHPNFLNDHASLYSGSYLGSKKHGYGKEVGSSGYTYIGQFQEGLKEGKGKLIFPDGSTYIGDFHLNQIHGKGALNWSSGDIYQGEFSENQLHGRGVMRWKNGNIYYGMYFSGQKHGQGSLTKSDGTQYNGEWQNGREHGNGILLDTNGIIISGIWESGKIIKIFQKRDQIHEVDFESSSKTNQKEI